MRNAVGPDGHTVESDSRVLGEWRMPKPATAGDEFDLGFAIVGSDLAVWFNGARVLFASDDTFKDGYITVSANGTTVEFRDIQWRDLTAR